MKAIPVIASILFTSSAFAEGLSKPELDRRLAMMKTASVRYNECVTYSAVTTFKAENIQDINAATEKSFSSCETEGRALVSLMQTSGFSQADIEQTMLLKRSGLKQELRSIAIEAKAKRGIGPIPVR